MEPRQEGAQQSEQSGRRAVNPIPFTSGVVLTEQHQPLVNGFTCAAPGKEETRYERDVSEWLKDRSAGALMAVRLKESEVRLFICPRTGSLMGYGAIGMETWTFPDKTEVNLWVLQYAGAHTDYRQLPKEHEDYGFGKRLLAGMIQEVEHRGGCEQIGLFVDPDNPAREKYETDYLFKFLDKEQDDDRVWIRMVRSLHIS